ncbi:uncharacterized protein LOC128551599, partial [Mercenaria mercenaria]|uniref:uncharacterized protein LOC128551599 n=1 Tax=Mercenaria mercenaria TaxID=6596 RepID=UPI00234F160A
MSSASYLSDFLENHNVDICGIAEHWLYNHNLRFLDQINTKYISHSIADSDLNIPGNRRVGKGGIAILWNQNLNSIVAPLYLNSKYIIGIEVNVAEGEYLYVFQTYLPCKNHRIAIFKNSLDDVENTLCQYKDKGKVLVMGDFNVELPARHELNFQPDNRGNLLIDIMIRNHLIALDGTKLCNGAYYSNVSYNSSRETLIDHILLSQNDIGCVKACFILDENCLNVSNHRPLVCTLAISVNENKATKNINANNSINWKNVKPQNIDKFRAYLNSSNVLSECISREISSTKDIDELYSKIISTIQEASDKCIPKSKFKPFIKPYWNSDLDRYHKNMSIKRTLWLNENRPRYENCTSFKEYKDSKRMFRTLHRKVVQQYVEKVETEIDTAAEIDNNEFWRLINKERKKNRTSPVFEMNFNDNICNNPVDINRGWRDYFTELYKPTRNADFDDEYMKLRKEELQCFERNAKINDSTKVKIEESMVRKQLATCKNGKAAG